MKTALQLANGNPMLMDAVRRNGGKLLDRRALVGAVASAVPVPGLDWAVPESKTAPEDAASPSLVGDTWIEHVTPAV